MRCGFVGGYHAVKQQFVAPTVTITGEFFPQLMSVSVAAPSFSSLQCFSVGNEEVSVTIAEQTPKSSSAFDAV